MVVVVLHPGPIIRDPARALAMRPYAMILALIALAGSGLTLWLELRQRSTQALRAMVITTGFFYTGLIMAVPEIQRRGTVELANLVKARAQPGDQVVHYHEFFHDFAFYAGTTVDVVANRGPNPYGELELEEDAAARASGRFMEEAEFRRRWAGSVRLWLVAEKESVTDLLADRTFAYYLLGETRNHYLLSNKP
jgi:hypothetical protein